MNILEEANKIVNERSQEKEREYGPFEDSMSKAAKIASELTNKNITTEDFYKCMIALKLSRISFKLKEDSLLDCVEFEPIRKWAKKRNIFKNGDSKTQCIKLFEETGELSKAILNKNKAEIIDAIGDCVVVLTNLTELENIKIEACINSAYKIISKRKGIMFNGTFIKQS